MFIRHVQLIHELWKKNIPKNYVYNVHVHVQTKGMNNE